LGCWEYFSCLGCWDVLLWVRRKMSRRSTRSFIMSQSCTCSSKEEVSLLSLSINLFRGYLLRLWSVELTWFFSRL
jgi:hypothetical protein